MKTYLFIDDDVDGQVSAEAYTREIELAADGGLAFRLFKPSGLAESLEEIAKGGLDGLLLDVAFTNATDSEGAPLAYDGVSLAQQIRTLQTRGLNHGGASLPELPIIRFSKKGVVREYTQGDTTSDDLFDEKIVKDDIVDHPKTAARQMSSIATDYPRIVGFAKVQPDDPALAQLLGCDPSLFSRFDPRALLGLRRPGAAPHILSRQLIGVLLRRPGPLVEESLMAIRLGIDLTRSPDWHMLKESLQTASYQGTFSAGYLRWWMPSILDWWAAHIDQDKPLTRLGASERVEMLRARTGLAGLEPIGALPESPGSRFWHQCIKSGLPVDPSHGYPLFPVWGQEVWQDAEYLCEEEAFQDIRNPRLSSSEKQRAIAAREKKG